jgi:amidase
MKRLLIVLLSSLALMLPAWGAPKKTEKPFTVVEASIADMQAALRSGRVTSHELVQQSLTRIATYEDKLHAIITVNPKALEEADALDRERAAG